MKTQFSRIRKYVPIFNGNQTLPEGEQLVYGIKPMTLDDFYVVLEAVSRLASEEGKLDPTKLRGSAQREFMSMAEKFIPQYVVTQGAPLFADDDSEVPLAEACASAPFLSLLSELINELMVVSRPTEMDVKN